MKWYFDIYYNLIVIPGHSQQEKRLFSKTYLFFRKPYDLPPLCFCIPCCMIEIPAYAPDERRTYMLDYAVTLEFDRGEEPEE